MLATFCARHCWKGTKVSLSLSISISLQSWSLFTWPLPVVLFLLFFFFLVPALPFEVPDVALLDADFDEKREKQKKMNYSGNLLPSIPWNRLKHNKRLFQVVVLLQSRRHAQVLATDWDHHWSHCREQWSGWTAGARWYSRQSHPGHSARIRARRGGRTLRKDVILPSKHLLSAFHDYPVFWEPFQEPLSLLNPARRLLTTLLRSTSFKEPFFF